MFVAMAYTKDYYNMDAKQRIILQNEIELNRLRKQIGILPKMQVINCCRIATESTFNLRDLNKELINNKQ